MIEKVEKFLDEFNIKNKPVILGFSAGPDSCALALILNSLKKKYNLDLILAYFNHNWRIEESKKEEEFSKDFAKKFNLKAIIKKAPENSAKTEENARNLRYDFFRKTALKYKTDVVFLAHNKNDNIETLIYRVIKGTSIQGLCSIPKNREIFYRPMLEIEKSEILKFLKKNNQNFMFDSSNDDTKYKRNLIRKEILPLFKKINPNYLNNIEILIKNSISSRKIVKNTIFEIKNKIIKNNKIQRADFLLLDVEYRLEILNDFLGEFLKYRNYKNLLKFDDFILNNENSKTSINSSLFLKIKNNEIYFEKKQEKNKEEIEIFKEGEYFFENICVKIEKTIKNDKKFVKNNKTYYLEIDFPLTLRHRKNGDIFSPYGLAGKMKLKDYLINEKIEQNEKDKLILLCKNNEVCLILGKIINEHYKVKNKDCYKITWRQNG